MRETFIHSFIHSVRGYLLGIGFVLAMPRHMTDENSCHRGADSLVGTQVRNTIDESISSSGVIMGNQGAHHPDPPCLRGGAETPTRILPALCPPPAPSSRAWELGYQDRPGPIRCRERTQAPAAPCIRPFLSGIAVFPPPTHPASFRCSPGGSVEGSPDPPTALEHP